MTLFELFNFGLFREGFIAVNFRHGLILHMHINTIFVVIVVINCARLVNVATLLPLLVKLRSLWGWFGLPFIEGKSGRAILLTMQRGVVLTMMRGLIVTRLVI